MPTVGCVNALCERLAAACGGFALTHPYGCSQLGEDHETTANLLAALCRHPNAGGVLVVGLGCENNTLDSFKARLGDISKLNIRFLRAQDPGDEYAAGLGLIRELESFAAVWNRVFPGDRGADGRPVVKLFVTGNHDVNHLGPLKNATWLSYYNHDAARIAADYATVKNADFLTFQAARDNIGEPGSVLVLH